MQTQDLVSRDTKTLLTHLIRIRDDIAANGPSERLLTARQFAVLALEAYRLKRQYERTNETDRVRSRWLEPVTPMTDEDRRDLAEAEKVDREIAALPGMLKLSTAEHATCVGLSSNFSGTMK